MKAVHIFPSKLMRLAVTLSGADADVKQTLILVKIDAGAYIYGASLMADSGALIAVMVVVGLIWVLQGRKFAQSVLQCTIG